MFTWDCFWGRVDDSKPVGVLGEYLLAIKTWSAGRGAYGRGLDAMYRIGYLGGVVDVNGIEWGI